MPIESISNLTAHKHPTLPFIEARPILEWLREKGWTEDAIHDAPITGDWVIIMDGQAEIHEAHSPAEGFSDLERRLFDPAAYGYPYCPFLADKKLEELLQQGEYRLAINFAELRGQWRGRIEMQAKFARARATLKTALENVAGFAY